MTDAAGIWPHTKRPLPWVLAGFMAMLFLVPFDSASLPFSLPLEAKLDRPYLMLIAAVWVLSMVGIGTVTRLRVTPLHWALLIFILIAIVSLILNDSTIERLGDLQLSIRKLALLISYSLLFVIVASSIRGREVRNFVTFAIALSCVMAFAALIEYRTGYNVFFNLTEHVLSVTRPIELGSIDSIGRKSVVGPTVHPLAVAMMMALILPFTLMRLLDSTERRDKWLYGGAVALMLAGALATQRKTSVVAPASAIIVLLAYRPRAIGRLVPGLIVMFALIHVAAPGALGGVTDQLMPQNLFGVLSTKDRQSDYGAVTPDIVNRPAFGRGYESYDQKKYRILDNQYLTTIIGTGIIGLLAYLAVFLTAIGLAHRVSRSDDHDMASMGVAGVASVASFVVASQLLDTLALAQLAYLICFVMAMLVVLWQAETAPAGEAAPAAGLTPGAAQARLLRPRWLSDQEPA